MVDVVKQTTPVSQIVDDSNSSTIISEPANISTKSESQEEKLRRAKIAMEGLDRTIRREATEKEEAASEEKQQLNKLLLTLNHEKELMELTWVNLDDKRASLKKILAPILEREDKLEDEETNIESQEEVTLAPQPRRELEQKRWQIQESRKKTEEEKWLIEEKIQKIDDQINEIKQKYQQLLAQEEEVRQKIQNIDERMLLEQEVLHQQNELEEQKRQQETLKKIEEQKRAEEIERKRLADIKQAEEDKQRAEEERRQAEIQKQKEKEMEAAEKDRLEKLRQAEEERQKAETARRLTDQQIREQELKRRIAEAIENNQASQIQTPPEPPIIKPETIVEKTKTEEKEDALIRALELERIKKENAEAEANRSREAAGQNRSVIDEIKESEGELEPLRTLRGDLEVARKNNRITDDDLARVNKKTFPWAK